MALSVTCVAAAITGCHAGSSTRAKTIAIITPAGANEFNADLAAGAADKAKLLGWNPVNHLSPSGDADDADLVALAMKALSDKPDAISVCGMDPSALQRVVRTANADSIPVFVHNQISTITGDVAAYIGYDEFAAGRQCGDYAVRLLSQGDRKNLPVGQVAILDGAPGEHSIERAGGFREALKYCAGVQIIEEKSGEWSKDKANHLVTDWLTRYPKLSVIFACNDNMAIGAAEALHTTNIAVNSDGRTGANRHVSIIGFGGTHEALVRVKYGELAATLALEPRKIGSRIVTAMMDTLAGGDTVHPGEVIHTDTTLVNSQNLDDFIGGFDSAPLNPAVSSSAGSGGDVH